MGWGDKRGQGIDGTQEEKAIGLGIVVHKPQVNFSLAPSFQTERDPTPGETAWFQTGQLRIRVYYGLHTSAIEP